MARARGRGRGRGQKTPIMNVGSSVGAPVEAIELREQEQVQNGEASFEDEVARSTKVARRLSLNTLSANTEVLENSDLESLDDENKVVNGQTMVQLEGKEVQEEEQKWKCALIAYVIGECPGYNTMKRYTLMNWSKVDKPKVFLHEYGARRLVIYVKWNHNQKKRCQREEDHGKKVTQTWQYKGPISQKTEQEKVHEQRKENNLSPQKNKQEEEQEIDKKLYQQTPRSIGEHSNNADKQLEFSLANFPILKAIPIRNGFESLKHNKMASLSIDKGGASKTC
ncbi:hypothetical protein EJD97_005452 [Solanum chilense]|uniref:DUF4283 domain-containing protein n=1 Tax=Solanum chilense TaxID=4083 RepID=A0A6N2CLT7_SOLCI|nr:hypothetical protein EJD97_005452 [Solanum chilense]